MKLAEWQDKQGLTDAALGSQLGVTGEAVRLWREGLRTPRPKFLLAIARVSGDKITQWKRSGLGLEDRRKDGKSK